jgi:hypothetical protein
MLEKLIMNRHSGESELILARTNSAAQASRVFWRQALLFCFWRLIMEIKEPLTVERCRIAYNEVTYARYIQGGS